MATALGATEAMDTTSPNFDGLETNENYSRFLILGGGLSGLSAGSHLSQLGIRDFKILEARKRLGGRVITVQIAGSKAELGASWIHGVLGNPLYELAVSKGLVDIVQTPKPHNIAAVTEDGRRLPFNVLQEIYEAYFWFFKRCEEYFLCKYQPPEGVRSVGQHIELEIGIYLQKFPPQQRHIRRLIFDYLLKRECCITGCDSMNEIDLLGIGSYTELPGGNITLPRGYASVLNPMIANIPEENILKGHPVKHIHWKYRSEMENMRNDKGYESDGDDDSVSSVKTVKSTSSNSGSTADGGAGAASLVAQSFAARTLKAEGGGGATASSSRASSVSSSRAASICATPLHKRSHPNVMIELEDGRKFYTDHVICTIPLGVLKEKSDLFQPELPADKKEALTKLNFGTVNKIYLEWDRPFLSPDISEVILLWDQLSDEANVPMADRWYRKIYSFCKVNEVCLVGWIAGEEAKFMETLKMNAVAEVCTAVLKKFLADPYVPKPKSCVFTAWYSQPYSRGSYSSIGIGGQQCHIEKIAEPLYQKPMKRTPVVSFAGEHTHPSFYSTGHGAFLSGRSSAQFFVNAAKESEEDVYNLSAASVADLSTWLEEVSMGEKNLEDYKSGAKQRPRRDDGKFPTPR